MSKKPAVPNNSKQISMSSFLLQKPKETDKSKNSQDLTRSPSIFSKKSSQTSINTEVKNKCIEISSDDSNSPEKYRHEAFVPDSDDEDLVPHKTPAKHHNEWQPKTLLSVVESSVQKHRAKDDDKLIQNVSLEDKMSSNQTYFSSTKDLNQNMNLLLPKQSKSTGSKFQYKVPSATLLKNTALAATTSTVTSATVSATTTPSVDRVHFNISNATAVSTPAPKVITTPNTTFNLSDDEFDFMVSGKPNTKLQSKVYEPLPQKPSISSQSPSKKSNVLLNFGENLNSELVSVFKHKSFKSKDYFDDENVKYLRETHSDLYKKYFNLMTQIPIEFLKPLPGFDAPLYMKLKSLIQTIQVKLAAADKKSPRLLPTPIWKSQDEHTSSNGSYNGQPHIEIPETETFEYFSPHQSQDRTPSVNENKSKGFTFKQASSERSKVPVPGNSFSSFNQSRPSLDNDDDSDTDEILKQFNDSELEKQGKLSKYNNINEIDLTTPDTSLQNKRFEPRINFAESSAPYDYGGTNFIEDVETQLELDDEGWQIFDYDSFKENDGVASGFQTANELLQKYMGANTVESIPQPGKNVIIKHTNAMGKFHAGVRNDGTTGEFDGFNYPHSTEMKLIFTETFGLRTYRPNQLQVINATLLGHDCFVLMPTGGGKSLCYQLPAIITKGVTIVVSPLKSLIFDQVNKLASLDIAAAHLSGEQTWDEIRKILDDIQSQRPQLKLLYVTPEKICGSAKFQDALDRLYSNGFLARFVIDEAHCVSQWGHDFRPDYKKLSVLKGRFPQTPMIALTATANTRVRIDLLRQLGINTCKWFLCSFNRPNLKYLVLPKTGKNTVNDMITLMRKRFPQMSGIVYCFSRKECESTADTLRSAGIKAAPYHAGMADTTRETTQKDWVADRVKVICATIAFGMGIDKPDVRFVFHHSMPKSIEGYYQESGRAGRDGEVATCILYYNYADMLRYRKMMDSDKSASYEAKQVHLQNLHRMVHFCENVTDCRRAQQLEYFAEHFTREQCLENVVTACDNCQKQGEYKMIDVTQDCIEIGKCVRDLFNQPNRRFTLLHLVDILKGSEVKKVQENGHNRTMYHGRLKTWQKSDIQRLLHRLVIEGYLREDLIFANEIPQAYLKIGNKIETLMTRKVTISFPVREKEIRLRDDGPVEPVHDTKTNKALKELQQRCYRELTEKCRSIASEKNVTVGSVMNMDALKAMSVSFPETQKMMMNLPHVTKANYEKYGAALLEITQNYAAEKIGLLMVLEEPEQEQRGNDGRAEFADNNGDRTDWAQLGAEASTSSGGRGGGRKRRGGWSGGSRSSKKFKRTPKKTGTRARLGTKAKPGKKSPAKGRRPNTGFRMMPPPGST